MKRRIDHVQLVAVGSVIVVLGVQLVFYGMPLGNWVRGGVLGLLHAMLAMGMALIYRANRVVNFAQGDLGSVPVAFGAALIIFSGWPYLAGLGLGLVVAVLLGIVVEVAIVRRFRTAPRLVLTVATLGISQLMVVLSILVPKQFWDENLSSQRIPPPLDWKLTIGAFILNANDLIAMAVAPLAIASVAWFLARSRIGLAVRASAERSDRASMLGIPVAGINTIVWAVAAVLAFLALFLRSGITGVPIGYAVGLPTLLLALAALVIGRLERLPTIVAMAFALGILEQGVQWNAQSPLLAYPIMAGVMFVVLLVQRTSSTRRDNDQTSSWRGAEEVRPLAAQVSANPWVATARWTVLAAGAMAVVLVPVVLRVDYVIKASALIAFAIIGMSLVVLTGWAGQISLGQMGIVGIGAAVSATCTTRWNVDLSIALAIGGLAGALSAFAVGVPALRLRGLYLAVTTFAFSLAVQSYFLNDRFFGWFPRTDKRFERLPLFGRIDVDSPTQIYAYSVVVLLLVYLGVRGIRRSRTGRVIVALRENERAAQSFSVSAVRAKLTAFVISGTIAGIGGALFAHQNQTFVGQSYSTGESLNVFISAVIGGLGSLGGALLGALYLRGTRWFIADEAWQLLSTGIGVLVVLLVLPGGIGGLWVKLRNVVVRILTRNSSAAAFAPMTQTASVTELASSHRVPASAAVPTDEEMIAVPLSEFHSPDVLGPEALDAALEDVVDSSTRTNSIGGTL